MQPFSARVQQQRVARQTRIRRFSIAAGLLLLVALFAVALSVWGLGIGGVSGAGNVQPAGAQGASSLQTPQIPPTPVQTSVALAGSRATSTALATTPPVARQKVAALPPPLQPFTGDPTAPQPPPTRPDPNSRYYADTGHYLSGDFLLFYNNTPKASELFGLPLTEDFPQELPGGGVYRVQYFERARFEYHPELPAGQRVQLGALAPIVLNGRGFERLPSSPSTATRVYFPETGHALSNGFLNYWKANGGLRVFGYPISEELGEDGLAVQYFERARFEYHQELEGTPYAVQLTPLGYMALKAGRFAVPLGLGVRFNPPRLPEGHSAVVEVAITNGVTVTGLYQERALIFKHEPERGVAWALLGATALGDTGPRPVSISLQSSDGARRTVTRTLEVVTYSFPSEVLQFDPETAKLLDPALTTKEREVLDATFAGRTPEQYWDGPFAMPLDGKIRITSAFATRRCYNCPAGSRPTTYHGGLDLGAGAGTPVRAPANGKIALAEPLAVRGNVVIIDHGMGVYSLFAHNSKLVAKVGQTVSKGDIVSLVGSTGLSTGPHLHWELHVSGPSVSPLEWTRRAMP